MLSGCNLKLIRSDKVTQDLTDQNCQNIIEAESKHSDLIPAKYEGDFANENLLKNFFFLKFANNLNFIRISLKFR